MKILLVDDDEQKAEVIAAQVEKYVDPSKLTFLRVKSLSSGIGAAADQNFDLIILDLMLPYIDDGKPDARAALELLKQLRREGASNCNTSVLAISAFPDEILSSRGEFDGLGVLLIALDEDGTWRGVLQRALDEIEARLGRKLPLDFLIVCALEEERRGFKSSDLEWLNPAIVTGLNLQYVRTKTEPAMNGAILRLSQMGLICATYETTLAISIFDAPVIAMSGICAGFSERTKLGQLVVAAPAWEYQAGKWSDNGFEIAPTQIPLRPATRAVLDQFLARDKIALAFESGLNGEEERPPRWVTPVLAPFATGSAVVADANRLEHIAVQHRKISALDMETYGFYYAAHEMLPGNCHYFSMKCVVDFADSEKSDNLHSYGCVVSARATVASIVELTRATAER